jgi:hypothetical protein
MRSVGSSEGSDDRPSPKLDARDEPGSSRRPDTRLLREVADAGAGKTGDTLVEPRRRCAVSEHHR